MRYASKIVETIIKRMKSKGFAIGKRNRFGFVEDFGEGIVVTRERGKNTRIFRREIKTALEAVRKHPSIYSKGPNALRPHISRYVYSPLWALLHLADLDELLEK